MSSIPPHLPDRMSFHLSEDVIVIKSNRQYYDFALTSEKLASKYSTIPTSPYILLPPRHHVTNRSVKGWHRKNIAQEQSPLNINIGRNRQLDMEWFHLMTMYGLLVIYSGYVFASLTTRS